MAKDTDKFPGFCPPLTCWSMSAQSLTEDGYGPPIAKHAEATKSFSVTWYI